MAITPLPTPPSRDDPANFAARGDTFLGALPDFATEANALAVDVNDDATSAASSALTATGAATTAVNASGASAWVSGTTYAIGNVVWSPTSYQTYRRKTNGAGITDPVSDTTNWTQLSGTLPSQTGNGGKVLSTNGTEPSWIASSASINRSERTSNTMLGANDKGKFINITSGSFTQTLDSAATLGDGWWCYLRNSGMPVQEESASIVQINKTLGELANNEGMCFSSDGLVMLTVNSTATAAIRRYTLTEPFNIETFNSTLNTLNVNSQTTSPQDVRLSSDGTKAYVFSVTTCFQYTLPTPNSLSGASYSGISYTFSAQTSAAICATFSADGTKMYVSNGSVIWQYTLSTAWNVATATYASLTIGSLIYFNDTFTSLDISGDGTKMMLGYGGTISQLTLSTAYNISTATRFATITFDDNFGAYIGMQYASSNNSLIVLASSTNYRRPQKISLVSNGGIYIPMGDQSANDITIDPANSETIDGLTSFIMYPQETRLIQCDGTAFKSFVISGFVRNFTTSSSFIKPPSYATFDVECWGAGAGGTSGTGGDLSVGTGGGGGGGGAYTSLNLLSSIIPQTAKVIIGAGGAGGLGGGNGGTIGVNNAGSNGGITSFDRFVFGQGGFTSRAGGGRFANAPTISGATQGCADFGGGAVGSTFGYASLYGGGAAGSGGSGSVDGNNGGRSMYAGGGGGGGGTGNSVGQRGGYGGGRIIPNYANTSGGALLENGGGGRAASSSNGANGVFFGFGGGGGANGGNPNAGYHGGNGGLAAGGGGGGGGGGTTTAQNGGNGGAGGNGFCRVKGVV